MTDDVKVLREAAEACDHKVTEWSDSNTPVGKRIRATHAGIAILCRRLADSIEREEAKGLPAAMPFGTQSLMPEYKFQTPDNTGGAASYADKKPIAVALSEAEDRVWNAALDAAENAVDKMPNAEGFTTRRALDAIRALRRGGV